MNVCRAIVLTAVGIWFAAGSIRVTCQSAKQPIKVSPATMAKIGTIDERYQSYNIEAVEVTGGRFWKPYGSSSAQSPANGSSIPNAPGGMDPSLYEYRSPIDQVARQTSSLMTGKDSADLGLGVLFLLGE